MSTCSSCGAEILWARTANGKAMPIDAEPTANGNIEFVADVATVIDPNQATLGPPPARYVSHFATCPNAAQHRKA